MLAPLQAHTPRVRLLLPPLPALINPVSAARAFHGLSLNLERETACDLARVLAIARQDAGLIKAFSGSQPARETSPSVEGARRAGFQTVSPERDAVPVWVALLALSWRRFGAEAPWDSCGGWGGRYINELRLKD